MFIITNEYTFNKKVVHLTTSRGINLQYIKKAGFVCLGGMIQGLGMGVFLFPHAIPSGGASGIAILINHFLKIPVGPSLWIVNLLLLVIGLKVLGKRFALWTFAGITLTSLSVHYFDTTIHLTERKVFYDLMFGSTFLGIGIGLLMRQNVSNGGIGILAFIITTKRQISPGKPLFYMNSLVFLLTAAFIQWSIIIYAFFSQWMATSIVNFLYQFKWQQTYTLSWRK